MDTYVFVDTPDGTELVNPGHPSLEGQNLIDMTDLNGKVVVRDYIAAALNEGDCSDRYSPPLERSSTAPASHASGADRTRANGPPMSMPATSLRPDISIGLAEAYLRFKQAGIPVFARMG